MADNFYPSYRTCPSVSPQCPVSATTYGYAPNLGGNAFFAAWFGLLLVLSLIFGIRSKNWTYTLALASSAILEFAGYIGRILMHNNPWNDSAFKLQIVGLVLAPSFLAASVYLTLKHLVLYFGPRHSLIKPRLYPWLFVGCDIGSICLQAIGGGIAASAGNENSASLLDAGNGLIVAGIAFQVATMAVCGLFVVVYMLRYRKARGSPVQAEGEKSQYANIRENTGEKKKLLVFCAAVSLAYIAILIRCIYRLPEMAGGWGNPLMQNETEFLILDGGMIALATFLLTAFHPAFFFRSMSRSKSVRSHDSGDSSEGPTA